MRATDPSATVCMSPPGVEELKATMEGAISRYITSVQEWVQAQTLHVQRERARVDHDARELSSEKEALRAEKDEWEKEKEMVMKIAEPSDVIELNVGGRLFTAQRSTLCKSDGLLSAMFSGRWDETRFARDAAGRIYLELDSGCFEVCIEWLRARIIDPTTPFPSPPAGKTSIFHSIVDYLQLGRLLEEQQKEPEWIPSGNARVLCVSSKGGALGDNPCCIFNDDLDKGWTSASRSGNNSWIVVDLIKMHTLRRIRLVFHTQCGKVTVMHGTSGVGPWTTIQSVDVRASECDISGFVVHTRFLRLSFSLPAVPDKDYVGIRQMLVGS